MDKDALERTLENLRQDYAEQLVRTVAQMEVAWRRLAAGEIPAAEIEALMRKAHTIAGAAGTFEFERASRAARALELLLDPLCAGARLPDSATQARIAALLEELRLATIGS